MIAEHGYDDDVIEHVGWDLKERESAAAFGIFIGLGFALPIVAFIVACFVAIWMKMLGGHPHHAVFGYISSEKKGADGSTVWDVGSQPLYYWFALLNLWLVYQLGELTWFGFTSLRGAMDG